MTTPKEQAELDRLEVERLEAERLKNKEEAEAAVQRVLKELEKAKKK